MLILAAPVEGQHLPGPHMCSDVSPPRALPCAVSWTHHHHVDNEGMDAVYLPGVSCLG